MPVPTPREQLSAALRNARLEAGFATHSKLAKAMNLSRPAISKAESPNSAVPSDATLTAWAKACRVPVEEFLEIVDRAKSGTPEWFGPYLSAEREATSLRFWGPLVVPGLLQAEAYIRAHERSDDVVRKRLERQEALGRARVTAAIDHRVLAHAIGSPAVMTEQCSHLANLVEAEKIRLYVVPEGANIGLTGAFAVATKNGASTLSLTTSTRDITSTAPDMVDDNLNLFEQILGIALGPVPSLEYVRNQEERWKEPRL
jgi:transcriptional regulator with XRE-family HTH domain